MLPPHPSLLLADGMRGKILRLRVDTPLFSPITGIRPSSQGIARVIPLVSGLLISNGQFAARTVVLLHPPRFGSSSFYVLSGWCEEGMVTGRRTGSLDSTGTSCPMNLAALFHLPKSVRLLGVTLRPDTVILEATTAANGVRRCPRCQTPSDHCHGAYSVHKTRRLLMKPTNAHSEPEAAYIAMLKRLCPQIADAQQLVTAFQTILSQHLPGRLPPWWERCEQSGIRELVGFAQGIRRDFAAVQAALCSPWSQGQVEGPGDSAQNAQAPDVWTCGLRTLASTRTLLARSCPLRPSTAQHLK